MKKEQWQDWIRSEFARDRVEPASEEFYRGVWSRVRHAMAASPNQRRGEWPVSIGLACWRALPVLSALVLLVAVFSWLYPPDFNGAAPTSVESYVLETDAIPSNADLLYQITHVTWVSELEAEP